MRIKVQAPLFKEGMKWGETGGLLKRYRAVVLKKLKRFGMEDIEDRIVTERALTPSGIERMYNTPGGATVNQAWGRDWGSPVAVVCEENSV